MKYLLCLLLIAPQCYGAVSFQRVKNVYSRLQNLAGYHVKLHYDSDEYANAYSDFRGISITQGMLNDLNTNAEIAEVLGHELAHHINRDYATEGSIAKELRADKIGHMYCSKLYSSSACIKQLYNARAKYGDEGDDGVHPSWSTRINKLEGEM